MFCSPVVYRESLSWLYLQVFPILSKLDPAVYGPPESALTKELIEQELNGLSVEEVLIRASIKIYGFISPLLPYKRWFIF